LDEDEVFDKYSCTPPSPRTLTKLKKRRERKGIHSLSTYSSLDEFQLTCNKTKAKFPSLQQQQRQRSIQTVSSNKRVLKKLSTSSGGAASYPSSFDSSAATSDDEEFVAYRSTLSQDLKVFRQ